MSTPRDAGAPVPGPDGPADAQYSLAPLPETGSAEGDGCGVTVVIDTSARRFRANVLANLVYFAFNAALQLWFTRYLVHHLGVSLYGLVPLAVNVTNCLSVLTVSLSGSVGRYLTIHFAEGDVPSANRTFNTSLFASIVLTVALIPVVALLAWFSPSFLRFPPGEEGGVRFLLFCTGAVFLLNTVGSNFACSAFAKNRFDAQRIADALGQLAQVGCVAFLFATRGPQLWLVGVGLLAMALVRQICYQVSWRILTPELRIRPWYFDRTRLREILSMGGWLTVDNAGAVLLLQLDLFLVNALCGSKETGLYAPALQWVTLLTTASTVAGSALAPTLIARYAQGRHESLSSITRLSVKALGLGMALPIGLLCGLSRPLLNLWLGQQHAAVWPLFVLLIAPLVANLPVRPLNVVNQAQGAVKWPALVILGSGVVAIAFGIVLTLPVGLGMYGVALSRGLVWGAKNALWNPLYTARLLNLRGRVLLGPLVPGMVSAAAAAGLGFFGVWLIGAGSWCSLLGIAVVVSLVYIAAVCPIFLSKAERSTLWGVARGGSAP